MKLLKRFIYWLLGKKPEAINVREVKQIIDLSLLTGNYKEVNLQDIYNKHHPKKNNLH